MNRVGIVCDSTCDLGPEWLARHDVHLVQMRAALDAAGASYVLDTVESVGAVIGTYAGPGAVGVTNVPHS